MISREERTRLLLEFAKRFQQEHVVLDEYRGQGFTEKVPGGLRAYSYAATVTTERPQNRWLVLAGSLFTFGGIFGFIVEQRLRRIRL